MQVQLLLRCSGCLLLTLLSPLPLFPTPSGAVGVYVPGGTAVLPSTALMLAVPAKIAG